MPIWPWRKGDNDGTGQCLYPYDYRYTCKRKEQVPIMLTDPDDGSECILWCCTRHAKICLADHAEDLKAREVDKAFALFFQLTCIPAQE